MSEPAAPREVFTPTDLNRLVRDLLEDALPLLWVEGEISNLARPASGHLYFSLKDAHAQIRCAMFRPKSVGLRFAPRDGMQVLVRGRVGLYEPRGDYQLIVEHMEEAGEGALQREFERLKQKLAAEGLFDQARKRALPRFPRRIGILSSPSGAAVRDVLSVLRRRFPLAEVDLLPVPVQGREAPQAIRAMLERAQRAARYDVLLLTRGGGSLEDLWAFNDEALARAIAASSVPVVSAVGHEIDFTLADFAADLRAATPSVAAELLVPDRDELLQGLAQRAHRLDARVHRTLQSLAQRFDHLSARLRAQRPQLRLERGRERMHALQRRLLRAQPWPPLRERLRGLAVQLAAQDPRRRLAGERQAVALSAMRLRHAWRASLQARRARLQESTRALNAVSPLATLQRGYAILFDERGRVIRSAAGIAPGATVDARLVDGTVRLHRGGE
jgi:exodeoxyribonuclease VII large subunit